MKCGSGESGSAFLLFLDGFIIALLLHILHIFQESSELNSKTNVFATSKQGFWDLNNKLKQGICYPIYLNNTAISEITNGRYSVTGKGIIFAGSSPDIMLMLGSGDVILTGRINKDADPVLYSIKTDKVV